ncbi:MAG TPA: DUF4242 domain-containing protein [Kofleriaceae bacterium]|nr:DUF4242 domain-containing protein [Kofleriaceae bacterium]HMG55115.1 DUF4242 domain-containing protein [Kofleriaceae bacterium]
MRRLTLIVGALTLIAAGCTKKDDAAKTEAAKTAPAPEPAKAEPAKTEPAAAPAVAAPAGGKKLFLDVHDLGKVSAKDVAEAHKKDLATEGKYGVDYKAYWVDEKNGKVYCLSEAPNADAAVATHKEAHGLVPQKIMEVSADNGNWKPGPGMKLYMDVHNMGKGKVTAEAVAEAHKKDLAVQDKHKTKYLNYWVDPDSGTIMCLSEAPSADDAVATHKEAHGLVPDSIAEVSEGR